MYAYDGALKWTVIMRNTFIYRGKKFLFKDNCELTRRHLHVTSVYYYVTDIYVRIRIRAYIYVHADFRRCIFLFNDIFIKYYFQIISH